MIVSVQRGSALVRPEPVGSASLAELFAQPRYTGARLLERRLSW